MRAHSEIELYNGFLSGGHALSQGRRRISEIAEAHRTANDIVSSAIGIAGFAGGGYYLDSRFGTSPVLTIVGSVLGFLFAGLSLRSLLRRLDSQSRQSRQARSGLNSGDEATKK